jgi:hypothetical protein
VRFIRASEAKDRKTGLCLTCYRQRGAKRRPSEVERRRRVRELRQLISEMTSPGGTVELVPGPNQSIWSLKTSVWRGALFLGVRVEVWDEGGRVYFRRRDGAAASRSEPGRRERKRLYDGYLADVTPDAVGELRLEPGDSSRSVQQTLRYAALREGVRLEIWRVGDRIYFQRLPP